jgi:hypothetical protein
MRRPIVSLSSLLLFAATALIAQGGPSAEARRMVVEKPAACPVELSATHRSDGMLLNAGRQAPGEPDPPEAAQGKPHQSLDFSMKNTRLERIVGAELEVHGTSMRKRVLRANEGTAAGNVMLTDQPAADAVRHVHLVSSVPAEQSRTRVVSVDDLTSVGWISVIELRYADGSTWDAGPGRECRVVPDPVTLIANK